MSGPGDGDRRDDESLVDLRCSVAVMHGAEILLVNRTGTNDWVLPGGRPRHGESMQSCARRETLEETGLRVNPARCAFVGEVIDPDATARVVELVFVAEVSGHERPEPHGGEPGATPTWVGVDRLAGLHLRPPIAGYLPGLSRGKRATAAYLGNLWRPPKGTPA